MKKTLLFGAAMAVTGLGAFAQSPNNGAQLNDHKAVKKVQLDNMELPASMRLKAPKSPVAKANAAVAKVEIGSSYNIYSVLLSQQQCLTVNSDLGLVGFAHRQNNGRPGGSGVIQYTYTTDGGTTVNDVRLTPEGVANRYPSAVLYNPNGNTDVNSAMAFSFGPQVANGGWANNYLATATLDSSSVSNTEIPFADLPDNSAGATILIREFLTLTEDQKARIMYRTDNGSVYTGNYLVTTSFNADSSRFEIDTIQNVSEILGGDMEASFLMGHAWSNDGQTGYVMMVSNDTNDTAEKWAFPKLAKTTDAGATWTLLPDFDFSSNTLTGLGDFLPNVQGQDYAFPFFLSTYGYDMQIDANGEFHLSIGVTGAYSAHKDSLQYSYSFGPGLHHIMHFYTTSTGWDYRYVREVQTAEVEASTTNSFGDIGWDHRVQSSRTEDGSKVFVHFIETNPDFADDNAFPDIFAWGIDVNTGNTTLPVNFTEGTDYDGGNYFTFMGDRVLSNAGTYTIPVTTTSPNPSLDPAQPVTHDLVTGIEFNDADFQDRLSVNEAAKADFNVTVYPNPAVGGMANINVNLTETTEVTVMVANTLGQTVKTLNAGTLVAGNNTIEVNVSDLAAGVYFYSVTANNNTVTKRLIVK